MNAVEHHPSREQLTAFVSGKMPEHEASELEAHLFDCDSCRAVLEALPEDTLVWQLRAADTHPDAPPAPPSEATVSLSWGAAVRPSPGDTSAPPTALLDHPRYRILELLGAGGMGAVYKAEHRLMERLIALKVISSRLLDRPGMVERFRREIRLAARLTHANIVTAHDAEQAGDTHFLVMEYVEGTSLDRRVKEQGPLPLIQACDYVRQAALGLQHAFERGMVHRDVKPANLMVTAHGQVKILDFGLAHLVSEAPSVGGLTEVNTIMGTPDYLAPEQIRDARSADIRADIYSLGCTLYTLLVGRPPFPEGSYAQTLAAHLERTPRRLAELRPDVPPALDRVVARMMAKEPARRYQTPAQVAEALAPFVGVQAARPPRRRWPWLAAALVLVGLLGIGGTVFGPAVFRIATDQGELVIETDDPDIEIVVKQNGRQIRILDGRSKREVTLAAGAYQLELAPGKDGLKLSTREFTLERGGKKVVQVRLEQPAPTRQAVIPRPRTPEPSPLPRAKSTRVKIAPEPLPEIPAGSALSPTALVQRPVAIPGVRSWTLETAAHRSPVSALACSPDGRLLATGNREAIRLWDPRSRQLVRVLVFGRTDAVTTDLAWSPDGRYLAAARGAERVVQLWEVDSGRLVRILPAARPVVAVAWSPKGRQLAVGHAGGEWCLWDMVSGHRISSSLAKPVEAFGLLAWSPDGKLLAAGGDTAKVMALYTASGAVSCELEAEAGDFRAAAWSPDGRQLATVGDSGRVHFWDVSTGKLIRRGNAFGNPHLSCLAWSPDGKTVAAGGPDGELYRVDAASGNSYLPIPSHTQPITKLCWLPDSTTLVSASADKTVRLLDVEPTAKLMGTLPGLPGITSLAWSADGKKLACGARQRALPIWEPATGRLVHDVHTGKTEVVAVGWSPDSTTLAYAYRTPGTGYATLWVPESIEEWARKGGSALAWSPRGRILAMARLADHVFLHDFDTKTEKATPLVHSGAINALAFSCDGRILASGGADRKIRLWKVDSPDARRSLEGHTAAVTALAWSPEDSVLASAGYEDDKPGDGIRLWDPISGKLLRTLGETDRVRALAWQPHGKILASTGAPETAVRLWSPTSGEILRSLPGHTMPVTSIAWAPHGKTIAAGAEDGTVGFWDPSTGRLHGWCIVVAKDRTIALAADGHWRASSPLRDDIVFVLQTDKGQETLRYEELRTKYPREDDSGQVRLMNSDE